MTVDMNAYIRLIAKDEASGVLDGVRNQVGSLMGSLASLAAMAGAGLGLKELVGAGITFNRTMEDSRSGIAAVLLATRDYVAANGELLTGTAALAGATAEASKIQQQLQVDAESTAATYTQLAEAFQNSLAPATAAGVKNLSQVREIVVQATQAMSALGIPTAQAGQEIRGMFSGEIGPDNRLNQILRITKDELEKVRGNADATAKLFLDKLKPFAEAAAEATKNFSVRLSNLGDAFDRVMGQATKPIFDAFKTAVSTVTEHMGGFEGSLNSAGRSIGEAIQKLLPLGAALLDVGVKALEAGAKFVEALTPIVPYLLPIVDGVGKIIEALGPLGPALLLIGKTHMVSFAAGVVGAVAPMFRLVEVGDVATKTMRTMPAILLAAQNGFASAQIAVWSFIEAVTASTGAMLAAGGAIAAAGLAIGALIYTYMEYRKATGEANAANEGFASTMLSNLDRIKAKHPEVGAQVDTLAAKIKTAAAQGGEAIGKQASDFNRDYNAIAAAAKAATPAVTSVGKAVALTKEQQEAAKKAAEEHRKKLKEFADACEDARKATVAYAKGIEDAKEKNLDAFTKIRQAQDLTFEERAALEAQAERNAIEKAARDVDITILTVAEIIKLNEDKQKALDGIEAKYLASVKKYHDDAKVVVGEYSKSLLSVVPSMTNATRQALEKVAEMIPPVAATIENAFTSIWGAAANLFDSAFYDVLSGRFDELGSVIKGFGDSMLKTLSKIFSDILQRWIAMTIGFEQNPVSGNFEWKGGGAGAGGGISGVFANMGEKGGGWGMAGAGAVGGLAGYGIGSAVGGMSGAPGFNTGATIGGAVAGTGIALAAAGAFGAAAAGAVAGSVVPIIGTIIGAIIGGLIGVLSSSNTEQHVTGSIEAEGKRASEMMSNRIGEFGRLGERIGIKDKGGKAITAKFMQDLYRAQWTALVKDGGFDISAGSPEDIQKNYEWLHKTLLPTLALQAAFGQKGYGIPHGNRDSEGGVGGFDWNLPSVMDKDGNIIQKQLYDKDAPIPKMLDALGFTGAKIGEIAGQIGTRTPDAFLAYVSSLVGVVVGLQDLSKKFGNGYTGLAEDAKRRENRTALDDFRDSATQIKDLAATLNEYTGDEQITKAQELISLASQRYEAEVQFLMRIREIARGIAESIGSQREGFKYSLMDQSGQESFLRSKIGSLQADLAKATAPDEIQRIVAQIQQYSGSLFNLYGTTGEGRAKTEGIAAWLDQILADVNAQAQKKLDDAGKAVEETNKGLKEALDQATLLFTDVNDALDPFASKTNAAGDEVAAFGEKAKTAGEDVALLGDAATGAAKALQYLATLGAAASTPEEEFKRRQQNIADVIAAIRQNPGLLRGIG